MGFAYWVAYEKGWVVNGVTTKKGGGVGEKGTRPPINTFDIAMATVTDIEKEIENSGLEIWEKKLENLIDFFLI